MRRVLKDIWCRSAKRLIRAFWLVMLVGHAPVLFKRMAQLASEPAGDFSAPAFVVMLLATVFFILKVFDVQCVRFRTDRRSCCALLLAVALMHTHLIPHAQEAVIEAKQVFIIANTLGVLSLVSVIGLSRRLLPRGMRVCAQVAASSSCWPRPDQLCDHPTPQDFLLNCCSPRPPPVTAGC